jgi:hypothetical protein
MEFLGIDFSGNVRSWSPGLATSNVWLCRVKPDGEQKVHITELHPIQCLAGHGPPFQRLADLLAGGQFSAVAILNPYAACAQGRMAKFIGKSRRAYF